MDEVFEFGNRPPAHRGLSLRPGGNAEFGKGKGRKEKGRGKMDEGEKIGVAH
jgi:hypothetical protein